MTSSVSVVCCGMMKTERLNKEFSRFSVDMLLASCFSIENVEDLIRDLTDEAGYSSPVSYLNDLEMWSVSLGVVIEDLVNSIYTFDGVLIN